MSRSTHSFRKNRISTAQLTVESRTMLSGTAATAENLSEITPAVPSADTSETTESVLTENVESEEASDAVDTPDDTQRARSDERVRRDERRPRRTNVDRADTENTAVGEVASAIETAGNTSDVESGEDQPNSVDEPSTTPELPANNLPSPASAETITDSTTGPGTAVSRPVNNAAPIDTDTPDGVLVTRPDQENFELVYSDEFNTRDRRKWSASNRDTNDPSRNYPDSDGNPRSVNRRWRASNTSITDEGALFVQTKLTNQSKDNDRQVLAGAKYTSNDAFKPSDAEGGAVHIEARVRFPRPQGPHAAFWLLPRDGQDPLGPDKTGADGAEIDIFETTAQLKPLDANQRRNLANAEPGEDGILRLPSGQATRQLNSGTDYIDRDTGGSVRTGYHINGYKTVPSNVYAKSKHKDFLSTGQDNIYDEWQTVGLTWSEEELKFFWEGEEFFSETDPTYIPKVAEQILFSSQITVPSFGGDLPDDLNDLDDQGLEVDWVRVFHQTESLADSSEDAAAEVV